METITIYKNIYQVSSPIYKQLDVILKRIKMGESKSLIKKIRLEKDKTKRNRLKTNLPAICFSGIFKKRNDKSILEHSGIICLDFDDYKSKKDLLNAKEHLSKDKYVHSVFISPSEKGLKVLVKTPKETNRHIDFFNSLEKHFNSVFFDKKCKNLSRVCYESYDPNIFINNNSLMWVN